MFSLVCFLSVILTRASKLLDVARAAGIEHGGAVIPSHVRVRAGVEELSCDLSSLRILSESDLSLAASRAARYLRRPSMQNLAKKASTTTTTALRHPNAVARFGADRVGGVAPPDGGLRRAEAARRLAMELGPVPRSTWLF